MGCIMGNFWPSLLFVLALLRMAFAALKDKNITAFNSCSGGQACVVAASWEENIVYFICISPLTSYFQAK